MNRFPRLRGCWEIVAAEASEPLYFRIFGSFSMKIAIIGLPNSGKTTVFNALTRGTAETSSFSTGRLEPNLAAVKVPDSRVDALSRIYNPKKTTYAEVQYVDIGGFEGQADKREALPSEMLNQIGNADALLHVVRSFQDAEVPHPLESINPRRDEERLEQELILSDLIVIERRLERLDKEIPKLPPKDRGTREVEHRILQRFRAGLEDGRPIRAPNRCDADAGRRSADRRRNPDERSDRSRTGSTRIGRRR
ncbi:MAG: 50S ribosome-binding GTPase [Acidobacteriota bacterium]